MAKNKELGKEYRAMDEFKTHCDECEEYHRNVGEEPCCEDCEHRYLLDATCDDF